MKRKLMLAAALAVGAIGATSVGTADAGQTNCNYGVTGLQAYRGCSTKTSSSWTRQRAIAACHYPQNGNYIAYNYGNWASVGQVSITPECSHFYGVYATYYGYQTS